jgi:hypothetical protein
MLAIKHGSCSSVCKSACLLNKRPQVKILPAPNLFLIDRKRKLNHYKVVDTSFFFGRLLPQEAGGRSGCAGLRFAAVLYRARNRRGKGTKPFASHGAEKLIAKVTAMSVSKSSHF